MSDSIGDVLGQRRYDEPAELIIVRDFVQAHFKEQPKLRITKNTIIINVSNAALASALRIKLHSLEAKLKTDKKLLIRIG